MIEACEYKRSFLNYKPTVWVITNIEPDHLDYFKDEADYLSAFTSFVENIQAWGFLVIDWENKHMDHFRSLRDDIWVIEVLEDGFAFEDKMYGYPHIDMQVAGEHILFDAKIAYTVGYMLGIDEWNTVEALEAYKWVWRRMENIWKTAHQNILMSDYGHHPTEIKLTLEALSEQYASKDLFVIFQPHQYNRTLELYDDFVTSFVYADTLILPNVYASRDSDEEKEKFQMNDFVEAIQNQGVNAINWLWLENTLELIQKYDQENPDSCVILLMWAWDVDTLRYKIMAEK